ncbi:MAG: glycosyltransferase [Lachnospiraceae bacterium]|nr:glycosyltransferase [Lachnospiraceae bacterium]
MDYLELSIKKLREEDKKLFYKVKFKYDFDLVIFIARGAYMIGEDLARLQDVPCLEIYASRRGNNLKDFLSPLLKRIPTGVKKNLRKREMNSSLHAKNIERHVEYDENVWAIYRTCRKILLVDDSVDTGHTIKNCRDTIEDFFPEAEVKVAVLNRFSKSAKVTDVDFYLYTDTSILAPWSNDSRENTDYLNRYSLWHRKHASDSISVVMATYNGERFLREQLDSIVCQLRDKDELIISDDGSTDGTLDIIDEYMKRHENIHLFKGPGRGTVENFENGLYNTKNKYILLADQDDIWSKNKLSVIRRYFRKRDCTTIMHDAYVIDEDGNEIMGSWFDHRNSDSGLLKNLVKNRYLGCCMAFDRKLLDYILPIPDIEMHDWWIALLSEKHGKSIFVRNKLIKYRRHGGNTSSLQHYPLMRMIRNRIMLLINLIGR